MKKTTIFILSLLSLALFSCKIEDAENYGRVDENALSSRGKWIYDASVSSFKAQAEDWLNIQDFLCLPTEVQNSDSCFAMRKRIYSKDLKGSISVAEYGTITLSDTPLDEVGGRWSTKAMTMECTAPEEWTIGVSNDCVRYDDDNIDFKVVLTCTSPSAEPRKQWKVNIPYGVYDEADGYTMTFRTESELEMDDSVYSVSGVFYAEIFNKGSRVDWVRLSYRPRSTIGYLLNVETSRGNVK